jgi:HNH endonuclease
VGIDTLMRKYINGTIQNERQKWIQNHIHLETDDCIIWPFALEKAQELCRWVCTIHYGKVPDNMWACHGPCQNRRCINYRHLSWQTPSQNAEDMYRDGTMQSGEKCVTHKLKLNEVNEIRKLYRIYTQKELGKMFRVNQSTISDILIGKSWIKVLPKTQTKDLFV